MRKPLILTAAFLLAATAPSFAQSQPPPAQGAPNGPSQPGQAAPAAPHHRTPYMMRALHQMNLSDAQRSQIKSLVAGYRQQNAGVTDPAARKANAQQLRSGIMAVLSPDQQTQLKSNIATLRQQHRQAMQQQGGQPPAGSQPPPNGQQSAQ